MCRFVMRLSARTVLNLVMLFIKKNKSRGNIFRVFYEHKRAISPTPWSYPYIISLKNGPFTVTKYKVFGKHT